MKLLFLSLFLLGCSHTGRQIASTQEKTVTILADFNELTSGLHKVYKGSGAPVVLVHGINPTLHQTEWRKPIQKLIELDRDIYFFKWDKFETLESNKVLLAENLRKLAESEDKIMLMGYSLGGVISMHAHDYLVEYPEQKKIELHTIAAPIYGYGAPGVAVLGIPFVGSTTISIGKGAGTFKHRNFNQCHHWVNTNCELDSHACLIKKKFSPQYKPNEMPCGEENTTLLNDHDHANIIERVFDELF